MTPRLKTKQRAASFHAAALRFPLPALSLGAITLVPFYVPGIDVIINLINIIDIVIIITIYLFAIAGLKKKTT